ncbi:MAG: calcium/sodium antiporter [Oscillospiraceae bacterium]|nr:calcium/sodium antiporter [Oscillospiraceae bacterium]
MDSIWVALIMFVAGVILVIKGGDWFVDAASWIARAANIPTFVIGATIVSIATTMPEMIVSVMASLEGKNDMAVGNAVGSVTANTGLIMALAFVFMTVVAPRKDYLKQCLILIGTAAVLWVGCLSGQMQTWSVAVLFAVFVGFMVLNVVEAKRKPAKSEPMDKSGKNVAKNVVMFLVGAGCIVLGSNLLIDGGSAIATALGVPERVIAVTMVAIGTSLPELVTTITAIRKKESSLSVGNIVGANIIDLALILPLCTVVSGSSFVVSAQCLRIDFPACMLVILIAMVPLLIRQKASRLQGILLIAAYVGYLAITI